MLELSLSLDNLVCVFKMMITNIHPDMNDDDK